MLSQEGCDAQEAKLKQCSIFFKVWLDVHAANNARATNTREKKKKKKIEFFSSSSDINFFHFGRLQLF